MVLFKKRENLKFNINLINKDVKTLKNSGYENNKDQILYILMRNFSEFKYVNESLKNDRNFLLDVVKTRGLCLKYFNLEFRDDEEIVSAAIISNRLAFAYVSDRLKNKLDIALIAVKSGDRQIYKYLGKKIRSERIIYETALTTGKSFSLQYAPDDIKNDPKYIMASESLQFASDKFKDDDEFVIEMLKINPYNLQFVSNRLKNCESVVKLIFEEKYEKYYIMPQSDREFIFDKYAGEIIKSNKKFIEKYISNEVMKKMYLKNAVDVIEIQKNLTNYIKLDGKYLAYANMEEQDNENVVSEAVKTNIESLKYASERIRNDEVFIRQLLEKDGNFLLYSGKKILNKRENYIIALNNTEWSDEIAELWKESEIFDANDIEMFKIILPKCDFFFEFAGKKLKSDKEFCKFVLSLDGYLLSHCSTKIKDDKEFVLLAVRTAKYEVNDYEDSPLRFASKRLKDDIEVVKEAIKHNKNAVRYASERVVKLLK